MRTTSSACSTVVALGISSRSTRASSSRSPSAVTVTIVSMPTDCLSAAGRVEREQPAVVDDREPVAELVGLLHVVRGEEDRLAVAVQLAEDVPERDAALRVEAGGRLVEEQDRGPVHDRPGHHEPLGHAAGEREHRRLRPIGQAELLEQSAGLGLRRLGVHAEEAAVEVEVLPDRERAVERVRLRDDADHLLRRGRVRDDVDATDERMPAGGDHAGGEHPRGRRLAGAVRAEQTEDLAPLHREVEPVDRVDVARDRPS